MRARAGKVVRLKDRWERAVTESKHSYEAVGHFGMMLRDLQEQVERQAVLLRELVLFREMDAERRHNWLTSGEYPYFAPEQPKIEGESEALTPNSLDSVKADTIIEGA